MHRLLLFFLLLTACSRSSADKRRQAEQDIRNADNEMSKAASQEGFYKTLLAYADEQTVKYQEGSLPIVGKLALSEFWKDKPDTKSLSWTPFKVEAATSGDLGYSLGFWRLTLPDTTLHGNYYTIWKKQSDGTWKFVLDGGNGTPEPSANQNHQ